MARSSSLKIKLAQILLRAARIKLLQPGFLSLFRHMDRFLPVERLFENENWLAFEHPQPVYPLHILLLPKKPIPSLMENPLEPPEFYRDLMVVVRALVERYDLERRGYRLITNGGPNQSIPQWHWHLISENPGDVND
jgi:histidine triad (HIT) family protein